jgi:hypothetical protein
MNELLYKPERNQERNKRSKNPQSNFVHVRLQFFDRMRQAEKKPLPGCDSSRPLTTTVAMRALSLARQFGRGSSVGSTNLRWVQKSRPALGVNLAAER